MEKFICFEPQLYHTQKKNPNEINVKRKYDSSELKWNTSPTFKFSHIQFIPWMKYGLQNSIPRTLRAKYLSAPDRRQNRERDFCESSRY